MRFKAKVEQDQVLLHMCTALNQICSRCYLRMCPKKWTFLIPQDLADGNFVSLELNVETVFESYRIESKMENKILIELIDMAALICAVRSCEHGNFAIVKLTRRNKMPVLAFEMMDGTERQMSQNVPIELPRNKPNLEEPDIPTCNIAVKCPPLKSLKTVCDRLSKISNIMEMEVIHEEGRSRLACEIKTDMAHIRTIYRSLEVGEDQEEGRWRVKFDVKKLTKTINGVLSAQQYSGNILLCFVEEHSLVVHAKFQHDLGVMTTYVALSI